MPATARKERKRPGPEGISLVLMAEALRKNAGNVMAAAQALNITESAVYQRLRNHPELAEIREETRQKLNDLAESHLFKGVQSGKWDQVRYWLDRQAKDRGYVTRQEQTGADGAPLQLAPSVAITVNYVSGASVPETKEEVL